MYHLTLSAERRRTICPSTALLRRGVRVIDKVVGSEALLFSLVDDHVHVVVRCSRSRAGYLGSGLRQAFARLSPDRPLRAAYVRPVEGRSHLVHLATDYIAKQPAKHGLAAHPALYEGGCFQDLLKARLLDHFRGTLLAEELPRFRLREVFPTLGLEKDPVPPVEVANLPPLGAARLAEAARAAFATDALGRSGPALWARRTAAVLARRAGLPLAALSQALDVPLRTLQRDARSEAPGLPIAVVLQRLGLEQRCATRNRTST
ncbi:MAG: hypothetical protein AAB654_21805 [Acidobacteriota bacterium]